MGTWWQRMFGRVRASGLVDPAHDIPTEPTSVPSHIDLGDEEDVLFWSRVLGVAPADVLAAGRRVGNEVSAVARELLTGTADGKDGRRRR